MSFVNSTNCISHGQIWERICDVVCTIYHPPTHTHIPSKQQKIISVKGMHTKNVNGFHTGGKWTCRGKNHFDARKNVIFAKDPSTVQVQLSDGCWPQDWQFPGLKWKTLRCKRLRPANFTHQIWLMKSHNLWMIGICLIWLKRKMLADGPSNNNSNKQVDLIFWN